MIVCPLLSGSSGNSTYVESGSTRVLVDAGAAGKTIEENLSRIGVDPRSLTHLLVTHAHDDHVRGIGVMSRRYGLPVVAPEGVWRELLSRSYVGRIETRFIKSFCRSSDAALVVGDMTVRHFPTAHDAADSVGYVFSDGKASFGVATDLGRVDESVRSLLLGCDAVLLEANYDRDMLWNGPYPYVLKKRVASNFGHLDNRDAGTFAVELARSGARDVFLGHLSENNNAPLVALGTVQEILEDAGVRVGVDCRVYLANRYAPSRKIEL